MARYYEYRVATYRRKYDGCDIDTKEGWAYKGFVPIQRRKGEVMYTSGWLGQTAEYFYRNDVKEDRVRADAYLSRLRDKRNARRRELVRSKKDRDHAKELERMESRFRVDKEKARASGAWYAYLGTRPTAIIFDTETTGYDADESLILTLSWQLVGIIGAGGRWMEAKLGKGEVIFDWSEGLESDDVSRPDRLPGRPGIVGVRDGDGGLGEFLEALDSASIAVAHNADFDCAILDAQAMREGLYIQWPKIFCTMKQMTRFCAIPWGMDGYKWPTLEELASRLDVDLENITSKGSSRNVEITKRCFLKILGSGVFPPFTIADFKCHKDDCYRTAHYYVNGSRSVMDESGKCAVEDVAFNTEKRTGDINCTDEEMPF